MREQAIELGGAVVYWSLAEWTDRARLHDGFATAGFAAHVPDARPLAAVLRDALKEAAGGPGVLVRPLRTRDGFAVVEERRGEAANAYRQTLAARVAAGGSLEFDPEDGRAPAVRAAFERRRGLLRAARVSAALVGVLEGLGGTRLRPGGSVYWVPPHRIDDWLPAAQAAEAAGLGRGSATYVLRHRLDADAVRAVRDVLVAEVEAEAARIEAEVLAGDLGAKALTTRRARAEELRGKILLYEDLLDVGLGALRAAVDRADRAAAAAAVMASAHALSEPAAPAAPAAG